MAYFGAQTGPVITIAAEFEDCMQRYQLLCAAMEANPVVWGKKATGMRECRIDLLHWGYRIGAATRALDYALHKSSDLRDQVVELLEDLNASLQSGRCKIECLMDDAKLVVSSSGTCAKSRGASSQSVYIGYSTTLVLRQKA
jgi:hypothetical protein